jgi:hypothetical protein
MLRTSYGKEAPSETWKEICSWFGAPLYTQCMLSIFPTMLVLDVVFDYVPHWKLDDFDASVFFSKEIRRIGAG